jgi:hypothetical protein
VQQDSEEENIALISRVSKGSKKGPKKRKKEESSQGKKVLSHVKCFTCHQRGHYANQCP